MRRVLIVGFIIWLAASITLRFTGQYLLMPASPAAVAILLLASFPLMALVARRVCADAGIPREQWPAAGIMLVLPSLVLDTFSTIFFPMVYPNIPGEAAALFGGWILICCAGALLGVSLARQ
jgi:Family of unknown function (DUF5367)